MDRNECRFTVLFQPPFWVGIGERWTEEGYQAARVVFGAEPSDAQVYQWVLRPGVPVGALILVPPALHRRGGGGAA